MISRRKGEIRFVLSRAVLLAVLAGVVWYCHKPTVDTGFEKKSWSAQDFHNARQVVWVNADSLRGLLSGIQAKEPQVFSFDADGSEWTFSWKDKKAFERIFLDGEPLSNWDTKLYPSIKKLKEDQGFSLETKEIHDRTFVRIPAEIMQSLQLSN